MMAKTPPMGWNSWNTFAENINENLIRETADALVEKGYAEAGYNYVVIDDCWSERERGADGRIVPSHEKFPHGMKALSDYLHSKGLKFGMYSCCGTKTCAYYPASYEHEFLDAQTFASWGVDYLKYDYCYKPAKIEGPLLYRRMAMALRSCGRDILFSACNWGADNTYDWIRSSGAHIFRSTGDIFDNWESIKNISLAQVGKDPFGAPYCYNDMDMLIVGMYGKGHVGIGGNSDVEYRTHFSLWCLQNSPLMIGGDIRSLGDSAREILLNRDLIAINQDEEGRQPYIAVNNNNDKIVWVRPLSNGDYAIGFFNFSDQDAMIYCPFWDIGLSANAGFSLSFYDVWKHETVGVFREGYATTLSPHACDVFRVKLVKD